MIRCDEFLKILLEEDGGKTKERREAFLEHERSCADCRESAADMKEAYETEEDPHSGRPDPMEERIMALAREHVAKNQAEKKAVAAPRTGRVPVRWLAVAAALVVGLGLGFVGGLEARGLPPIPVRSVVLDTKVDRWIWLAKAALEVDLKDEAHELARRVLKEPGISQAERNDAEAILKK